MMKIPMSPAATAMLRGLLGRAGVEADRILLSDFRSTDWRSLTFEGERHELTLRIPPPGSMRIAERLLCGLGEHEFALRGHVVADIAVVGRPAEAPDGATIVRIEALTIAD